MLSFCDAPPPELPLEEELLLLAPALPEPDEPPPLGMSALGVGTPVDGAPPPALGVPIVECALLLEPPL